MTEPQFPSTDFDETQLVVDLQYEKLVTEGLEGRDALIHGHRFQVSHVDDDDALGLALLRLHGVESVAEGIKQGADVNRAAVAFDAVIAALRARFQSRFGGWLPTMGKNRTMRGVLGTPGSQGIAIGPPSSPLEPVTHSPIAAAAHGDGPRGGRTRVGILDTRLHQHPDLSGHYSAPSDALLDLSAPNVTVYAGHGTFVAGLVAMQAPDTEIVYDWVLDDERATATAWATAKKMVEFSNRGVDVLNLSFACRTADGVPPLVMRRAIEVLSPRTLVVAAAGNHNNANSDHPAAAMWPAALPSVVAVGAFDDVPNKFSPELPWVTCTARGNDVLSTFLTGKFEADDAPEPFENYAVWSGTSFAAATTSGAIAARVVPGQVTARGALQQLLETPNPVVRKYVWPNNDGQAERPNGGPTG